MYLVALPLFIALCLGIWLKSWWLVAVLTVVGLAVSIVGWQAGWFADEDTPALGGAIVFEMAVCVPVALGAAFGVYLGRAGVRKRRDDVSTLPVIAPPSDASSRLRRGAADGS